MSLSIASPANININTFDLDSLLNECQQGALDKIQHSNFSPQVIQALTNQIVREAVSDALKDLKNAQPPLPQHLYDDIMARVNQQLPPTGALNPAELSAARSKLGSSMDSVSNGLRQSIVDDTLAELKSEARASGGSWLQAIAKALGKMAGQKAAKMVELSERTASLSSGEIKADVSLQATKDSAGNDIPLDTREKAAAAAETQQLLAENKATGEEFRLITETLNNVIKSLGESMRDMARK